MISSLSFDEKYVESLKIQESDKFISKNELIVRFDMFDMDIIKTLIGSCYVGNSNKFNGSII